MEAFITTQNEALEFIKNNNLKNAIIAAQKIQYLLRKMLDEHVDGEDEKPYLSPPKKAINIGMGYGECMICHVGGIFGRKSYFAVGDAINQS